MIMLFLDFEEKPGICPVFGNGALNTKYYLVYNKAQ
jgi:hypothetical protein